MVGLLVGPVSLMAILTGNGMLLEQNRMPGVKIYQRSRQFLPSRHYILKNEGAYFFPLDLPVII